MWITHVIGNLFTTFIANKLDKLMDPDAMLNKDWDYVKGELAKQVYDGTNYRADIAAVLTTRFCNFVNLYFDTKGSKTEVAVDRILKIIEHDKMLFSEDLIFSLIKTLQKNHPTRCNKLLLNPKVARKLI